MDLILCHTTADFDTLGAAVGLTRLQPGARIVLAGGAHPAVRNFLALHRDEYALIERRSVTPDSIRSISVVDTQSRSRLGKTAEWLDLPQVTIQLYDHHLNTDSDIPAACTVIEPVGAVATLVVEQLQANNLTLTPVEATAMALGIHVDTGSLTFDHTTVRDAKALAWLMEQGANLKTIADYIDPGLSPQLQQLLTTALDQLQTVTIQGHTLGWVLLKLDSYVPGLSSLTSRLIDVTEVDAFLLAAHYCRGAACRTDTEADDDTLTIIARSRIDGTNLNELLKPWGGGGHPRAASANLHDVPPQATLDTLVAQLQAQLPQPPTARELMSSPVRTIRPETTIDEAQRILLRYGHSGLSVVDADDRLVGVISRRDLDIALHHGFSHAPVKGYMTTNLKTITPDTLLPEIESLMVTYDVGRLPVLDQGELIGIVTRTDVLRQIHQADLGRQDGEAEGEEEDRPRQDTPNLRSRHSWHNPQVLLTTLRDDLKPELWEFLTIAAVQAEQRGWQLYLVGGAVRDLLLAAWQDQELTEQQLIQDVDLVVDGFHRSADVGAGVELARSLQETYPQARLDVHGKFQTAALLWHNDPVFKSLWVDIATARTEFYPYPAANPEVEASSIRQDLYRRDFTINALAIRLTAPRAGEMLDFFGGVLDLQARQVRVLHANSFIEDPTRIYRAVRFAVRLGFQIDPQTEGYIRHAIASGIYEQLHDRTDGNKFRAPALQTRLRAELKYILQSSYWLPALRLLADLGAFQCIHPTLQPDRFLWRQLRLAERWLRWTARQPQSGIKEGWLLLLEVLLAYLPQAYRAIVAEHLQLPHDSIERLHHLAAAQATIANALPQCQRPSQIGQLLQPYEPELLVLVAIRSSRSVRKQIWRYLTCWSQIKAPLDGRDLQAMGYRPGPQFKQILQALMAATLDGDIANREQAEIFLKERFPGN
ncbi:CBS domain-containing protein [Pantanalinema sp. GBBB05]|uniref:CBS domain-containing protein n=1 Tax=Pantanalinema sp. GBBB05 TaxID=2604139 RepID=UPI001DCFA3C2|nr:CBS domain-containing protein [Pantanalinema sp. GBBB05]